ncbi:TPA: hypothetical protein HA239_05230 [Candidatus Woesearchaeota archaeon]|nr:hypothetical protein QT06_C0001G0295 [archaeon GW2011_AR15]MBS3103614.1 hypothetical protein [Candidatus Woesearchaeota archaeon]HIH41786.1 hypothetical protein [Candidatus Woesearchaeota archaeon]
MNKSDLERKISPGDFVWVLANVGHGDRLTRNSAYIGIYQPDTVHTFYVRTQVSYDGVNDPENPEIGLGGDYRLLYSSVHSAERILSAGEVARKGVGEFGPNAAAVYLHFFKQFR